MVSAPTPMALFGVFYIVPSIKTRLYPIHIYQRKPSNEPNM